MPVKSDKEIVATLNLLHKRKQRRRPQGQIFQVISPPTARDDDDDARRRNARNGRGWTSQEDQERRILQENLRRRVSSELATHFHRKSVAICLLKQPFLSVVAGQVSTDVWHWSFCRQRNDWIRSDGAALDFQLSHLYNCHLVHSVSQR